MAAASRPLPLAARAVLAVAVVACLAGPWLFDANSLTVLTEFFVVLTLALMWNLLAGYADIISVGQQGFVGVGAYAFFGFTALAHLNVWLAVPLAALTTLVVAVPVMAVIFRLRTAYLAVGTWVASPSPRRRRAFQAVHDVDLSVGEGEIVSIIGANGAGKSSFLKALVRQAGRVTGSARFARDDLAVLSTRDIVAKGIALVPEGRKLFPSLARQRSRGKRRGAGLEERAAPQLNPCHPSLPVPFEFLVLAGAPVSRAAPRSFPWSCPRRRSAALGSRAG